MTTAPALRALSLGDETAASLGVDVARVRLSIVAAGAIGAGAAVAVAGAIGFVGLVAPHRAALARLRSGSHLMAVSARRRGAAARGGLRGTAHPVGRRGQVGVLTALLGVPVFLWIIARRKAELADAPA